MTVQELISVLSDLNLPDSTVFLQDTNTGGEAIDRILVYDAENLRNKQIEKVVVIHQTDKKLDYCLSHLDMGRENYNKDYMPIL